MDATNRPHLANFGPSTDNLDSDLGTLLDDHVGIVGKLGWGGIGIVLDLFGHQLHMELSATVLRTWWAPEKHTWAETKSRRGPA